MHESQRQDNRAISQIDPQPKHQLEGKSSWIEIKKTVTVNIPMKGSFHAEPIRGNSELISSGGNSSNQLLAGPHQKKNSKTACKSMRKPTEYLIGQPSYQMQTAKDSHSASIVRSVQKMRTKNTINNQA